MEAHFTDEVLQDILQRLTFLYLKIELDTPDPGVPTLDLPPLDLLSEKVAGSSFKVFTDPSLYTRSERAGTYPNWSSNGLEGMGADVYRVFFNGFSQKIYVDLNGPKWNEIRARLDAERLYCEILKTLIFVLSCGVKELPNDISSFIGGEIDANETEAVPMVDTTRLIEPIEEERGTSPEINTSTD